MGFCADAVRAALYATDGDVEEAVSILTADDTDDVVLIDDEAPTSPVHLRAPAASQLQPSATAAAVVCIDDEAPLPPPSYRRASQANNSYSAAAAAPAATLKPAATTSQSVRCLLVVDNKERTRNTALLDIEDKLMEATESNEREIVKAAVSLKMADYIWLRCDGLGGRDRAGGGGGGRDNGEEDNDTDDEQGDDDGDDGRSLSAKAVMPLVLERKTVADIVARSAAEDHLEQAHRMAHSGLGGAFLIEGNPPTAVTAAVAPRKRGGLLGTARGAAIESPEDLALWIVETAVRGDAAVLQTRDIAGSVCILAELTAHHAATAQHTATAATFSELQRWGRKGGQHAPWEPLARGLASLPGVEGTAAGVVAETHGPTLSHLHAWMQGLSLEGGGCDGISLASRRQLSATRPIKSSDGGNDGSRSPAEEAAAAAAAALFRTIHAGYRRHACTGGNHVLKYELPNRKFCIDTAPLAPRLLDLLKTPPEPSTANPIATPHP
jgi:ERCC4-type nuclease